MILNFDVSSGLYSFVDIHIFGVLIEARLFFNLFQSCQI